MHVFGTDFPPGGTNNDVVNALAGTNLFNHNDMQAIKRENAVRLLPQFT